MRLLDGLRVLDFTRVYSGPYTTLLLSDMGAEVVKVEHPGQGDDSRTFGPLVAGTSGYFETLNRGKQSIAVDFRDAEGQVLLRDLAGTFDVVIENFRPGQMTRYGLGAETLRERDPALVYASISGFGQFGPQSHLGCYDVVAQAVSGLMSLTGLPNLPVKTGPAIADAISGLTAAVGVLSALWQRERTGLGAVVDVAMVDAVFAVTENAVAHTSVTGQPPVRAANADMAIAPFDCFQAQDGNWLVFGAASERTWRGLVDLVGPRLDDTRFQTNADRLENHAHLRAVLADWCIVGSAAERVAQLHEAGVPAGMIRHMGELLNDAHLEARDMLLKLPLDDTKTITVPGSPLHIAGADRPRVILGPKLGEHTELVLSQMGVTATTQKELRERGVIA